MTNLDGILKYKSSTGEIRRKDYWIDWVKQQVLTARDFQGEGYEVPTDDVLWEKAKRLLKLEEV